MADRLYWGEVGQLGSVVQWSCRVAPCPNLQTPPTHLSTTFKRRLRIFHQGNSHWKDPHSSGGKEIQHLQQDVWIHQLSTIFIHPCDTLETEPKLLKSNCSATFQTCAHALSMLSLVIWRSYSTAAYGVEAHHQPDKNRIYWEGVSPCKCRVLVQMLNIAPSEPTRLCNSSTNLVQFYWFIFTAALPSMSSVMMRVSLSYDGWNS